MSATATTCDSSSSCCCGEAASTLSKPSRAFVVYCASSSKLDEKYFKAAQQIGETCAMNGISVRYGGGNCGLSKLL